MTASTPPKSRATILVVDDEVLIQMSTTDMLQDLGYDTLEAGSGQEAFELLRGGAPVDLVITDQAMSGMTGVELARAARELRPGLPFLISTGYADLPEGAGAELPRLGKPYRQDELARRVAELLAEQDEAAPLAAGQP